MQMMADVGRQLQSTHLTLTTFHITPQREHVQKRALWAFIRPQHLPSAASAAAQSIDFMIVSEFHTLKE
jgi:hypothetical protein